MDFGNVNINAKYMMSEIRIRNQFTLMHLSVILTLIVFSIFKS